MVNRFFFLLLGLISSSALLAQKFEMGLTMGASGYTMHGSRSDYYNTAMLTDVDFGITISIPVGMHIFVQPELVFTRRSAETSIGSVNNVKMYSEALEIPLLLHFRKAAPNSNLSFYGYAGPSLTLVHKQRLIAPASAPLPASQKTSFSLGDIYKVGAVGEIGVRWDRSETRAFTVGLRGSYDFDAMTKSDGIPRFKFKALTLKAGYIVKF